MTIQAVPLNFLVPDMMCDSCGKKIVAAVMGLDTDAAVTVNPETKQVQVTTIHSSGAIKSAIEAVGFEVSASTSYQTRSILEKD